MILCIPVFLCFEILCVKAKPFIPTRNRLSILLGDPGLRRADGLASPGTFMDRHRRAGEAKPSPLNTTLTLSQTALTYQEPLEARRVRPNAE